jgi:hypothetical protein
MPTTLKILLKATFWLSVAFIAVTCYALTFGQSSTYEFADWEVSDRFYNTIMPGLPIAILLTLTGTVKQANDSTKNATIIIATMLAAGISFFVMVSMLFSVGFVRITNDTVLYRHKASPTTTIVSQTIGYGALGGDGHRVVKLEPFLHFWNKRTRMDTAKINKAEWILVDEGMELNAGE